MTRVDFYFNAPDKLATAARLVRKACRAKKKVLVFTRDAAMLDAFDRLLWERHVNRNASTDKHQTWYWSDLPTQQLHFWLTLEAQRLAAPVFREFRRERSVVVQELRDRRGRYDAAADQLLAFDTVPGLVADSRRERPETLRTFSTENLTAESIATYTHSSELMPSSRCSKTL